MRREEKRSRLFYNVVNHDKTWRPTSSIWKDQPELESTNIVTPTSFHVQDMPFLIHLEFDRCNSSKYRYSSVNQDDSQLFARCSGLIHKQVMNSCFAYSPKRKRRLDVKWKLRQGKSLTSTISLKYLVVIVFLPSMRSNWPGEITFAVGNISKMKKRKLNMKFGIINTISSNLGDKIVETNKMSGFHAPPPAATSKVCGKTRN